MQKTQAPHSTQHQAIMGRNAAKEKAFIAKGKTMGVSVKPSEANKSVKGLTKASQQEKDVRDRHARRLAARTAPNAKGGGGRRGNPNHGSNGEFI